MRNFAKNLTNSIKSLPEKTHPSCIFYALVFGAIVGFALCHIFSAAPFSGPFWLIFCAVTSILSIVFARRVLVLFVFLAGVILASCRISPIFFARDYFSALEGRTITISGVVSEDPEFVSGGATIRLKSLKVHQNRDRPVENSEKTVEKPVDNSVENSESAAEIPLAGTLYVKLSRAPDSLERSDRLTLEGKLSAGFGTFVSSLYRPEIVSFEKPAFPDIFARFKNFFAEKVRENLESPAADLGLSYLLGLKSGLSDDFSEKLRNVGMTHVVVASGAHLAILVSAARRIFGKISKFAGTLFAALAILAFAAVVGFTPSMTRAALVALLGLFTAYVGRKFTPFRLLGFAAALTLSLDPTNLLNLGWQLSFASFFGILILGPRLSKFLYGAKTPPWLANMLLTSLATSLVCAPILIYNFGTISLLSFVANLVILPTLPYAMLLTLITGATAAFPALPLIFAKLAELLLGLHIWLIEFLSEKTIFVLELSSGNPLFFLLYIPILLLCVIIKP